MSRTRASSWLLVVLLAVCVVVLFGCGKKSGEQMAEGMAEKALENATGGDAEVDLGGGDVTIKTKDGTATISETAEWPADMFAEVPRFGYGVVERVSRTKNTQDGQQSMTVWIREVAEGSVEKYGKELEAAGWESQMAMTSGQGGMISAQKGNIGLTVAYNTEEQTAALNVFSGANQ